MEPINEVRPAQGGSQVRPAQGGSQVRPAQGGSRIRKLILDKVRQLGTTEHQEIFTLLRTHGIAYSSNSNGVFINLSTVPDDVLAIVKAFVDYCAINKTGLDEYEKRLQECKITHKFDMISALADGDSSTDSAPTIDPTAEQGAKQSAEQGAEQSAEQSAEQGAKQSADQGAEQATTTAHADAQTLAHPFAHGSVAQTDTAQRPHLAVNSMNTVPSVLVNGRFQATKKRFARRKIVDRKQQLECDKANDGGVLVAEEYSYKN